jgi:hypothetical protein
MQLLDLLVKFRDDLKQEEEDVTHVDQRRDVEIPNLFPIQKSEKTRPTNEVLDTFEDNFPNGLGNPSSFSKYNDEPVSSMPLLLNLIPSPEEQSHRVKYNDRSEPLFTANNYDTDPFLERSLLSRPNEIDNGFSDRNSYDGEDLTTKLLLMNDIPRIPDVESQIVFQPDSSFRKNRVIPASKFQEETLLSSLPSPASSGNDIESSQDIGVSKKYPTIFESTSSAWMRPENSFPWGRIDESTSSPSSPSLGTSSNFLDSILYPRNHDVEDELAKIYSLGSLLADED